MKTVINHDAVPFKQWQTTDRSNFIEVEFDFHDFLDELCDQIKDLTNHNFIAESHNKYFKYAKEDLSVNECVVVLDFAENFYFIVQDAVQCFHWNSSQATIHSFVIYCLSSEKSSTNPLDHLSIVCIRDHLQHDAVSVLAFRKLFLNTSKSSFPIL